MKLIALGDIHGRNKWKHIINKEIDANKIVFIGDYFDSHDKGHSANRQIENFKDIIAFKKANRDKVVLLIGNHDFHYIRGIGETYSGFQTAYAHDIGPLVEQAIKDGDLQVAYHHLNFLFTHAGLTKTWCQQKTNFEEPIVVNEEFIRDLNDYLTYKPNTFKFNIGPRYSQSGNDVTQGPIWVRIPSLVEDMVDGVICVVGHTPFRKLTIQPHNEKVIMIDCLGDTNEYLIIEDGTLLIGKL